MEQLPARQKQQDAISNLRAPNPFRRLRVPSLYRGPGLPPEGTAVIEPPEKEDVELIFDSVRTIVMTSLGERLLEPAFGSRVRELIFEPLDQVFELKTRLFLTDALRKYEPRCRIVSVNFRFLDNEAHITYTLEMLQLGYTAQDTLKVPRMPQ